MQSELKKLRQASNWPVLLLAMQWLSMICETFLQLEWFPYGIYPRTAAGLKGILLSPFIHGDWIHLFDNSVAFLFLGTMLFYFYRHIAAEVYIWIWLMGGLLTWVIGRPNFHIGSSHIIYGMAAFIFFSGMLRKNLNLMSLSMLLVSLYGGLVWGLLPVAVGLSWEGHLSGAIAGLFCAVYFRKYHTDTEKQQIHLADDVDDSDPYWLEGYEPKPKEPDPSTEIIYHYKEREDK